MEQLWLVEMVVAQAELEMVAEKVELEMVVEPEIGVSTCGIGNGGGLGEAWRRWVGAWSFRWWRQLVMVVAMMELKMGVEQLELEYGWWRRR
jgi:hypothetical protein